MSLLPVVFHFFSKYIVTYICYVASHSHLYSTMPKASVFNISDTNSTGFAVTEFWQIDIIERFYSTFIIFIREAYLFLSYLLFAFFIYIFFMYLSLYLFFLWFCDIFFAPTRIYGYGS